MNDGLNDVRKRQIKTKDVLKTSIDEIRTCSIMTSKMKN